jgi:hypothetical protein
VRASVDARVRVCCAQAIPSRGWPVLDLESAYQQTLDELPDVLDPVSDGYRGTVNLQGYDNTYTMDEWFGDFAEQWALNDMLHIRAAMLELLPTTTTWLSATLWLWGYIVRNETARASWRRHKICQDDAHLYAATPPVSRACRRLRGGAEKSLLWERQIFASP